MQLKKMLKQLEARGRNEEDVQNHNSFSSMHERNRGKAQSKVRKGMEMKGKH